MRRPTMIGRLAVLYAMAVLGGLAAAAPATAQTAQLSGFVTDESGAVIDGAVVTIRHDATGQTRDVKTNAAGQYVAAALANGQYTVTVTARGFPPVTQAVLLDVAQAARLDVTVKVGDLAETVNVSLEARPLESTDGAVSTMIDRRFITALPLNGRSLQSLISLVPGVVAVPAVAGSSGQFSVNGQRADTNSFSVDGVSAMVSATGGGFGEDFVGTNAMFSSAGTTSNLVSLDALQEFRVQTSSFAPEFGRTPGAQVQMITRSGANTLTGVASYYFRDDAMDANDWFLNRASLPKAKMSHHDVGGVLGGPLRRDRLFYFVSHESLAQSLPQATVYLVPSLAARASAAPGFQGVVHAFPIPNGPDVRDLTTGQLNGLAEFTSNHSDTTDVHATGVRVDATFGSNWSTFVRGQYAPSTSVRREQAGSTLRTIEQNGLTVTGGANATFGAATALEVRANYTRSRYVTSFDTDGWGGAAAPDRSYLFPTAAGNSQADFYVLLGGGLRRYFVGVGQNNLQHQQNVVASVSHARGGHLLKVGVDYRRLTPEFDATSYQFQTSARSLADLAAGRVTVFRSVRINVRPRLENFSLFAQDTWTVNSRLTLTYGLRWDVNPPFDMVTGESPVALTTAPDGSLVVLPRGSPIYETSYGNVAPRVGVSVRLTERERWGTVLKGGGGVFYESMAQTSGFVGHPNFLMETSPVTTFPLSASAVAPLLPPADPHAPPFTGLVYGHASDAVSPRSWQWNLGVVQALGGSQSVTLTYVGAAGDHLLRRQRLQPGGDFTGSVLMARTDATSSYHGLTVQATRRMTSGLQAMGSWTWSHAIDETSALLSEQIERGSAAFDARHSGNVAVVYQIPTVGRGRLVRALLGGWDVDGAARWRSGVPVDVSSSVRVIDGESMPVRPDRLMGVPLYVDDPAAPGGRRFNTATSPDRAGCLGAACTPLGVTGDFGRNVFRGWSAWQIDLALRRAVRLGGPVRLIVSAEVFNALNHPNFGQPNGTFGGSTYGRSTSMLNRALGGLDPLYQIGGPRSVQLGAKLTF